MKLLAKANSFGLLAKVVSSVLVRGCPWVRLSVLALPLAATPQNLLTVSEGAAKHAAFEKPSPTISQLARQMKVEGRVEVRVQITDKGSVQSAKLVSGNPLLGESVLIAVKAWKFHPFRTNNTEVPAMTILSFEFKQ